MKIDWYQLDKSERQHLIEHEILGYQIDALSDFYVFQILKKFNTYQITKQYPLKYRTIVETNKNAALADTLIDSVCFCNIRQFPDRQSHQYSNGMMGQKQSAFNSTSKVAI